MMKNDTSFQESIRQIRVRAAEINLSFNKLCKAAGIQQSTIWRWETGRIPDPHPGKVKRTIDKLNNEIDKISMYL